MLPNIIKEQSISAANGGHSPCDELSIGLVSSSSRSRLGQTIVLILPGGDTHQHNHQRQLLHHVRQKILQPLSHFTFIGQTKNTNVQSTTIFHLKFPLHEERGASGHQG